jgi:lincosamide nucleotidyltransferase A/C/D/E
MRTQEERVEEQQRDRWLRRLTIRAGRVIYPVIERSWLGRLVWLPPLQRIKYRIIYTPSWRVVELMDMFGAAEVRGWLAGGWGVDALLGRQTRPHCDIDLVIGDDDESYEQVTRILAGEGFRFTGTHHDPRIAIPWCHMWRHDAGQKVEVVPVPLDKPPFAADGGGIGHAFAVGSIDGHPVPCLSAKLQLFLHTGYPQRKIDEHDVALLTAYLSIPKMRTTA